MEKFVPYEKLSKKAKREADSQRRGSWNGVNPVSRKSPNPNKISPKTKTGKTARGTTRKRIARIPTFTPWTEICTSI